MIETILSAAKLKAILAVCAVVMLMGLYSNTGTQSTFTVSEESTNDLFSEDIQHRSDLVYNAVTEAMDEQGKQTPIAYKQTCESSLAYIQGERLNTNEGYNTLDAGQKELTDVYREYLKESANVVVACMSGEQPDTSEMIRLKNELY